MSRQLAQRLARPLASIVLAAGLAGCADEKPVERPATESAAAAPAPVLTPVDRARFDAMVQERAGKVVLVDFWATWCMPCLAQLPHTAELAAEYGGEGLAVITVSMDEADDAAQAAKVIAAKAGGEGLTHLISAAGGGPEAVEAFEISGGSVPHYKLYDRTGKLRQTFGVDPAAERQFTPEDIETAIKELLAE